MIQVHNNNTLRLIENRNDNGRCKFYNIGIIIHYIMTMRRVQYRYLHMYTPGCDIIYTVIHWAKVTLYHIE